MTTPAHGRYDVPGYIAALGREGDLLAAVAERAGMGAAVPSCPGWAVRDLLKHTGYVHRWATGIVAQGLARPAPGASEEEILAQGPGDAELPGWFREGHAALVRTLTNAPPDFSRVLYTAEALCDLLLVADAVWIVQALARLRRA